MFYLTVTKNYVTVTIGWPDSNLYLSEKQTQHDKLGSLE